MHRQDFMGAGDGEGDDGDSGFDRDVGGSVFEWLEDAVGRAASVGKNKERDVAVADGIGRQGQCLDGEARIAARDGDMAGLAKMRA